MILFDIDTLADDSHRRHFIDPSKNPNFKRRWDCTLEEFLENRMIPEEYIPVGTTKDECLNNTHELFKPNWPAFYEACSDDRAIQAVIEILEKLSQNHHVEIWSGNCESVRERTEQWIKKHIQPFFKLERLKMRPIGDARPLWELKEMWVGELMQQYQPKYRYMHHDIDFVFDSDPESIAMFRRWGIFVFDCKQGEE